MNKTKILFIVGIALAVIIIGLVILALTGKNNTNTGGTTTGSTITLKYWGLWEPEGVMQPLIDKYEAANPGVKIQYSQKTFEQYESSLYTQLVQGTTEGKPTPDIFRIHNTWLPKFQAYLSPLPSTIMSTQTFTSTYYPTVSRDFTGSDGKIYGMPLMIDGLALFYNKKLLQTAGYTEPAKDWDSFVEQAKKLTITDTTGKITQSGAALGASKNIIHSVETLNLLFLINKADILSADRKTVTLNTLNAQLSLDYLAKFTKEHKTWSSDSKSDLELFYSGKLAFMFAPSWRAFDIIQANTSVEFGIAKVPQLSGNQEVNYATYWAEGVSKTSVNATEAWKFVNFLSQPEQLRALYQNESKIRAFGEPYPRVDMANESVSPYVTAILQMAPTMKSWQYGDENTYNSSIKTAINSVTENSIDSSTALKEAETTIQKKLAEFSK